MRVYMAVTQDEYSLPIAIADSAYMLACMMGVREATIQEALTPKRIAKTKRIKYVRVDIDEEDDADACQKVKADDR